MITESDINCGSNHLNKLISVSKVVTRFFEILPLDFFFCLLVFQFILDIVFDGVSKLKLIEAVDLTTLCFLGKILSASSKITHNSFSASFFLLNLIILEDWSKLICLDCHLFLILY